MSRGVRGVWQARLHARALTPCAPSPRPAPWHPQLRPVYERVEQMTPPSREQVATLRRLERAAASMRAAIEELRAARRRSPAQVMIVVRHRDGMSYQLPAGISYTTRPSSRSTP